MAAKKATAANKSTGGASQELAAVLQGGSAASSETQPHDPRPASGEASDLSPDKQSGTASNLPSEATPRRGTDRIPFGKQRQRLAYPTRPGFVGYWFNDDNDRIDRALQAGWAFVNDRQGKPVSRPVGKKEGGGPLRAFRMELPEEIYAEDFKAEQRLIDEIEAPIKEGNLGAKDGDNRYVPKHTPIKFEQKRTL